MALSSKRALGLLLAATIAAAPARAQVSGGITRIACPDGTTACFAGSGGGTSGGTVTLGPSTVVIGHVIDDTVAAFSATAPLFVQDTNDGQAATNAVQPTGGTGILGWLSGAYIQLTAILNKLGAGIPITTLPALPAGTSVIGHVVDDTVAAITTTAPLPVQDVANGAAASAATQPAGGAGFLGWMSGLYVQATAMLGKLTSGVAITNVSGATLGVADPSNASYLDMVPITPGTAFTAGRGFAFVCTTSGNITITLSSGRQVTIPVVASAQDQTRSYSITNVALGTGTAATFWNLP